MKLSKVQILKLGAGQIITQPSCLVFPLYCLAWEINIGLFFNGATALTIAKVDIWKKEKISSVKGIQGKG